MIHKLLFCFFVQSNYNMFKGVTTACVICCFYFHMIQLIYHWAYENGCKERNCDGFGFSLKIGIYKIQLSWVLIFVIFTFYSNRIDLLFHKAYNIVGTYQTPRMVENSVDDGTRRSSMKYSSKKK